MSKGFPPRQGLNNLCIGNSVNLNLQDVTENSEGEVHCLLISTQISGNKYTDKLQLNTVP